MQTTLNIKNFRVFDENGATFELNPITILTGANSSGKSTVVKAVFLLNSFLSQIKQAIDNGYPIEIDKYKLDFTQYPINLLGRFDKIINEESKAKTITIEYTVYSHILSKNIITQLVFSADENDQLNNAYLESITMSTKEGIFYSSSKTAPSYCNLSILKEDFATFLLTEFAIKAYSDIEFQHEFEGGISEEDYQSRIQEIVNYLRSIEKSRRSDILRYVRKTNRKKAIITNEKEHKAVEQIDGKNHIFEIPLIEVLADLRKEEIERFVESHFLRNAGEALNHASRKVIAAFKESAFENFADFFQDFEKGYLGHAVCSSGALRTPRKGVRMLHSEDLKLQQEYIVFNPHNLQTVRLDENERDEVAELAEKQMEIKQWENRPLSFEILYEVVMEWNRNYHYDAHTEQMKADNCAYTYEFSMFEPFGRVSHTAYTLLTKVAEAVVHEAVTPEWADNMSYVGSSRVAVSRLYTLDINDDFAKLLQSYFEKKRLYLDYVKNNHNIGKRDYEADSFMNSWIKTFKIGNSISMHIDDEGLGVQIRLHKKEGDTGRLLADEGYGITQLVSILLQIETAILSAKGERINHIWRMENLDGYNFEKFHYEINIVVEEPEIHLHPKYQSLLADMFVEAYQKYNIHFIIETHSEYLIRKLQLIAGGKGDTDKNGEKISVERSDVSIFYVNAPDDKTKKKVKRIEICRDGYLDDTFGEGFYDEATKLSRRLM